jgi:CubicO group peptidase (beta-lactamase class C family)
MPDPEDHDWEHPEYDDAALKRYVSSLRSLKMIADPGQKFSYSSLGFNVLGALIAEVSGEPFEAYIKQHVFEPLGMHDSTFLKPEVPVELATSPHIRTPRLTVSDVFPYSRPQAPSGALQSSATDMCLWALANLNGGAINSPSHRILSSESYLLLWKPKTRTGQDNDLRQARIGLGWFVGEYKGMPAVMHDGGDIGYEAEVTLLHEQSVAVTVMANVFPAVTTAITRAVLDAVLGFGVQMPKPPLLVRLMATMRDAGLEAAVAQYRLINQDAYDTDITFLRDSVFILQEAYRPEDASELLKLSARIYPESDW